MRRILISLLGLMSIVCVMVAQEARPIRVACVGNSITYGAGIKNRFQHSYPGVLQQLLGKRYDVRNFGVSARTMLKKGDHPYMNEQRFQDALDFQPDIVAIKLGTNDSKPQNWKYGSEFVADLREMIAHFRSLPVKPEIYLCLPVPPTRVQWDINDSTIVHGVIPAIRQVAEIENVHLIDLYTALEPYPQYFPDFVHPNEAGATIIAQTIFRSLTGEEPDNVLVNQTFPGKESEWNGYKRYDFTCLGRDAIVVVPEKAAEGTPWIWRPAFFGAFASVDVALLQKGFHVAYYDLTHLYGSPRAIKAGTDFYRVMCDFYKLSPKVVVEGFSRGGYCALNWAVANPEKVSCLYLDAPVCDITSWPGRANAGLWNDFLKEWDIRDEQVDGHFEGNVIHRLEKLGQAKVPIISVCGDNDTVVPYKDNMFKIGEAYQAMGGVVETIVKPGCGHHPHSLENPEPIVDFILRYQNRDVSCCSH